MAVDVVCGMDVDEAEARDEGLVSDYDGDTYYFCGAGCKKAFDKDPQQYIGSGDPSEDVMDA